MQMIFGGLKHNWLLLTTIAALVVSQWRLLSYYWLAWSQPDGYYSHALLVPILAGIMVWQNKNRLDRAIAPGSWLGLPVLLLAAALSLAGIIIEWQILCGMALILFLFGIILSFVGRKAAIILLLPVLFLCLMIPMSPATLDGATNRFQTMSTVMATGMLKLFDSGIVKDGNVISSTSLPEPLLIGVPCSGLKLLIALFMATSFMAYSFEGPKWRRIFLIALAPPLAILVNSIRIVMIGLVGMITFSGDAIRAFHDYSGYIGLALCATIVMLIARLLGLRTFWIAEEDSSSSPVEPLPKKSQFRIWNLMPLICLAPVVAVTMVTSYLNDIPKGVLPKDRIPMSVGDWQGYTLQIEPIVSETLNKGDLLNIAYSNYGQDKAVQLFATAALDMTAFHDPRVCIPSSGSSITKLETSVMKVANAGNVNIPISVMYIKPESGEGVVMVYWYVLADEQYASSLQSLRRDLMSAKLRALKDVMLHPSHMSEVKAAIDNRQVIWCRFTAQASDYKEARSVIDGFINELPKDFVGFTNR